MRRFIPKLFVLLPILFIYVAYLGGTDRRIGIDVSPAEANSQTWWFNDIPETATRVRYYGSYQSERINAWMSETEFKEWAVRRGWELKAVKSSAEAALALLDENGDWDYAPFKQGWFFDEGVEIGVYGYFDADREMACIIYSAS